MKKSRTNEAELFYRRAVERLSPAEREKERGRDIPYSLSFKALSGIFFQTGMRQGWLSQPGTVVLAVSGGSDSMALMWFFRSFYEGRVVVAHMEHGIRGQDSVDDARFVEDSARRWSLDSKVVRADVPGLLRKGESLEAGARRLRYEFLETAARESEAAGVALGHNREDVAETVLFNLVRGTGVRGVVGIPERRGIFFRPLLGCSRDFLRAVLSHREIGWRDDRTNADNTHTRNFIRNELMPLIQRRMNPRVSEHLAVFAEEMHYYRAEEERRGDALAERSVSDDCEWSFVRGEVRNFSLRERTVWIREVARRLRLPVISRERASELAFLTEGKKHFEFQWGGGVSVLGDRDRVWWRMPVYDSENGE